MTGKKTGFLIAALVVAQQIGSPTAAAVPPDAVSDIRAMVQAGNVAGLRSYLSANPSLTEFDSPLSRALSEFLDDSGSLLSRLSRNGKVEALNELADVAFQEGIY